MSLDNQALQQDLQNALIAHRQGDFSQAHTIYEKLLHSVPNAHPVLHLMGLLYLQQGDRQKAISYLRQAIELSEQTGEYHLDLGRALMDNEEYKQAHIAFATALDHGADALEVGVRRAALYRQEGLDDRAVGLYLKLLEEHPREQALYLGLAQSMENLQHWEAARLAWENLQRLNPNDTRAQEGLQRCQQSLAQPAQQSLQQANAAMAEQDWPTAQQAYADAARANPDDPDLHLNQRLAAFMQAHARDEQPALILALPHGENFGWGICGQYLRQELQQRHPSFALDYQHWDRHGGKQLPATVVAAVGAEDLAIMYPLRGERNFAYTFFERDLVPQAIENAKQFDCVMAGSHWATQCLRDKGIASETLIQGIDTQLFTPQAAREGNGFFIFSGGKFELRKGQDLVLKAVAIMQQRHADVILVNAWVNFWPATMATMRASEHMQFALQGEEWQGQMRHLYELNGLDPSRVVTCDVIPHDQTGAIYARTDIGLFPNRCEGGTNLVLMEYMACGRPVIASYTSGQKDILGEEHALLLQDCPTRDYQLDGEHYARWPEPALDEILEQLEFAYQNRDRMNELGKKAGEYMQSYSWGRTADRLLEIVQ